MLYLYKVIISFHLIISVLLVIVLPVYDDDDDNNNNNNNRMDLKEIVINTRNWVDSAQDRDYWSALVNATLNVRVP